MTRDEEYAVMLAAVNLMFENVGKNGVILNLSEALLSVPGIKKGPDFQTDLYHFCGQVETAGEVAQIYREEYRTKGNKESHKRQDDGAAR